MFVVAQVVDEDEPGRVHLRLAVAPSLACGGHVRPPLFGGVERLFFKRQRARLQKPIDRRAPDLDTLLRQRVAQFSSVKSGHAAIRVRTTAS